MTININLSCLIIFLFVAQSVTFSQTIPQKFFDALIFDKPEITDYVNKDELAKSERLGVAYTGLKNKFMLGYELPDEIKDGVKNGKYKYEVKDEPPADTYMQVIFSVPDANFSKVYYFNDGFVTNSTYYTQNWEKKESKYFIFSIEELKYFNDYCIKRLDDFVEMIADTLGFTISEKRILEKEKLGYIFCADEKGVEKITGFNAKGLAMLGTDEVVTSYQTHFHEVAHLLINYKLKKLGLYTLPFFMEGFAVAVGGRGGMAPRVVTDLGYYLQKTGELTYDSIFTFDQFRSMDGSMTYPVSGLYNSFLLSELGGEKYLELYKKVNGDLECVKNMKSNTITIPNKELFEKFLNRYINDSLLYVDPMNKIEPKSYTRGIFGDFVSFGNYYKFFIVDKFSIGPSENKHYPDYKSKLLNTVTGDINYDPLKYYFTVDSSSIKIYNLLNDEMIYSYNKNLSVFNFNIPVIKGDGGSYFTFFVIKDYLNNDFDKGYTIKGSYR